MYVKGFKTVVFTKQKIIKSIIYFVSGIVVAVCISFSKNIDVKFKPTQITSDNLYKIILEEELPMQASYEHKVLFDIRKPQTILSYYSPIFDNITHNTPDEQKVEIKPTPTPSSGESLTVDGGMKVSNATKYSVNLDDEANKALPFVIGENEPQVLIVHTHTTESYNTPYSANDRTTDETKNIISVGNIIADKLNKNGIKTIHDTTVHDYPSYNGAYTRALETIKNNLEKYPSIKIVFDVHRDGIVRDDGTKVKVITQINGKPSAQVMIVAGSNASGLSHEFWEDNLVFAAHIQKEANEMYPSLMRPVNLREERFNTHMTKGSLILEIGSNGNSLDEAKTSAEYIADVICKVLKK